MVLMGDSVAGPRTFDSLSAFFDHTRLRLVLLGSFSAALLLITIGLFYVVQQWFYVEWYGELRNHALTLLLGGCLCLAAYADFRRYGFSWRGMSFLCLGVYLPILYGHMGVAGTHERNIAFLFVAISGSCFSYRFFLASTMVILSTWLFGAWWSEQVLDTWWYLYYFVIFPAMGFMVCWLQKNHVATLFQYQQQLQAREAQLDVAVTALDTERVRRLESEAAMERLREKMSQVGRVNALGEMVASIAHEINQPLNGILMHCGLLTMPDLNQADLDASVSQIETLAGHSAAIVKNLQDNIRNESPEAAVFQLADACQQAVLLTKDLSHLHGVPVQPEVTPPSIAVKADETQLTQVLVNLLRNAIQAVADGGGSEPVVLSVEQMGEGARVSIQDQGPGLPADSLEKIFSPFHSTKSGGMGMGLAISRSIVERLGSTLLVAKNPQGGLTFAFTIPSRLIQ